LDQSKAKTAEDLMRSRYTAFTMANGDYLIESHHKTTQKPKDKKSIIKWAKSVKWLKLEVLYTERGGENENEGIVEFKAVFLEGLRPNSIEEKSRFLKEDGVWFYVEAL
jgi:SEC-C motif-containing protein